MSDEHSVTDVMVTRQDLFSLVLVDYPGVSLEELSLEDLQSGKTEDEKTSLAASVQANGIRTPLLLLQRGAGETILVDGHHRAFLALREGYNPHAELHTCSCPSDTWDQFGLCPAIWAAHRERSEA